MAAPPGRPRRGDRPRGLADHGGAGRPARDRVRGAVLPALRRVARVARQHQRAQGRAPADAARREPVQGGRRTARPRRAAAADRGRPVRALADRARQRARRHRGGRDPQVRRDAGGRRALRVLRPRRAPGRLDGVPVLVLLRLQPLALGLPRRQRPRVGLGDGLGLPLRGRRPARAGVGGLRVARLPRRRPAPALGRWRGPRARQRSSRRLRRCRLARLLLPAGRVSGARCRSRSRRGCGRSARP